MMACNDGQRNVKKKKQRVVLLQMASMPAMTVSCVEEIELAPW